MSQMKEAYIIMAELRSTQNRMVYLITSSQADVVSFPTRESFCNAVLDAFSPTPAQPVRWVCGQEIHKDGNRHYHMALKLDRIQRWFSAKKRLQDNYGIVVNFSDHHYNYYSAWVYATKEDDAALHSPDHPDLSDGVPPSTANASRARVEGRPGRGKKRSRLSAFDVSEIIVRKRLKTRVELLAYCNAQKQEGKTDLAEFVLNRSKKSVDETLAVTWEMAEAQAVLDRAKLRRVEILEEARDGQCVTGCDGQWITQARDILERNSIEEQSFCDGVLTLLREGRGKFRNILITGPTNCGKSFLLQPLSQVYQAFQNPATTSYAWLGAELAEIIILNDFRWTPQV